jgi:putative two-component system response regulator
MLILARAAEAKDEATGEHVPRVGDLSARLGLLAGMPADDAERLRFAGMLHDVGKLHIPDRILRKPGRLTEREWALMREHTVWGQRILGDTEGFELARIVARWHHEDWDGTGYPDGLRGEAIPLAARIVHVTDVFDALASVRPYKPAWSPERCLEALRSGAGRQFDPEIVRLFLDLLEADPSLLRRRVRAVPVVPFSHSADEGMDAVA